jgi:hypothetical protein
MMVLDTRLEPDWYVRETLRGAFPLNVPLERRFVASLYIAYFDESGTHDDAETTVVAGFVSNMTQWEAFSQKWQQALDASHIDYMHMADFESRQGQFKGWSEDDKRDLLSRLLPIINEHTFYSIGCTVQKSLFDSIVSDRSKKILGDAYGVAALLCWRHLGVDFGRKEVDGWIDCTMEAGAKEWGKLHELFNEQSQSWREMHRIRGLASRNKRLFLPLQAADILAYELYKQSARQFGQETRRMRYPLEVLSGKKGKWMNVTEKQG